MDLARSTRRGCTTDQDPILGNDHNDASTDMTLRTWYLLLLLTAACQAESERREWWCSHRCTTVVIITHLYMSLQHPLPL